MTLSSKFYNIPIPELPPVDGWKTIPISPIQEKLVPLGPFLEPDMPGFSARIFQDAIYFGERETSPYQPGELEGALLTPFMREGVAKKLVQAASALPEDCALLIWDPYRPLSVQKALYDDYRGQLISIKGLVAEAATREAQTYVSLPSADLAKPSPHNTGGSVDLTIIKFPSEVFKQLMALDQILRQSKDWKERYKVEMQRMELVRKHGVPLNMGTEFDEAELPSSTRFYEMKLEAGEKLLVEENEYMVNRRILFHTMQRAGFSNLSSEWWHFDYGNQFHAKCTGQPAIYTTADFSQECQDWETMRVQHYRGSLLCLNLVPPQIKLGDPDVLIFIREIARLTGNPRVSPNYTRARRLEVKRAA